MKKMRKYHNEMKQWKKVMKEVNDNAMKMNVRNDANEA